MAEKKGPSQRKQTQKTVDKTDEEDSHEDADEGYDDESGHGEAGEHPVANKKESSNPKRPRKNDGEEDHMTKKARQSQVQKEDTSVKGKKKDTGDKAPAKQKKTKRFEPVSDEESEEVGKYSASSAGPKEVTPPGKPTPAPKQTAAKKAAPKRKAQKTREESEQEAEVEDDPEKNKQAEQAQKVADIVRANTAELATSKEDEKSKEEKKKDVMRAYKAKKAKFYRSLDSPKNSPAFRAEIEKAKSSSERLSAMQDLYERWLSCNQDWRKSTWVVGLSSTTQESRKGARRWMTKAQITKKYESEEISREIIMEKSKPEFSHQRKPHPDLPNREDLMLYLVWDEESEEHLDSTILGNSFSATDDTGTRKRKGHAPSTSEDSESDESSESSGSKSSKEESKAKKNEKTKKSTKKSKKDKKGKKSKTRSKKKGKETEEQKQKRLEREAKREEERKKRKEKRDLEVQQRKAEKEKQSGARKVLTQLTNKIRDVGDKMKKAQQNLSHDLATAVGKQFGTQRDKLQKVRDDLQAGLDQFEEKTVKKLADKGESALEQYEKFLESVRF